MTCRPTLAHVEPCECMDLHHGFLWIASAYDCGQLFFKDYITPLADLIKSHNDKTEFIVLRSNPNLSKVKTHSITVGEHQIRRSNQVRNIGAVFDANAKMEGQVTKTCQTAWFHLYTISKISQYLTKEQKQTIIHAYVTPRPDQNSSLLGGLPLTQMNKLQLVQNSAAKIILGGKKHDHVTDHLIKLHWLPISQRRVF